MGINPIETLEGAKEVIHTATPKPPAPSISDISNLENVVDLTNNSSPYPIPPSMPSVPEDLWPKDLCPPPAPSSSAPPVIEPVSAIVGIGVRSSANNQNTRDYLVCKTSDYNNFRTLDSGYKFILSERTNYFIMLDGLNGNTNEVVNRAMDEAVNRLDHAVYLLSTCPGTYREVYTIANSNRVHSDKIDKIRLYLYNQTNLLKQAHVGTLVRNNRGYLFLELAKRFLMNIKSQGNNKMPLEPTIPTMPENVTNLESLFADAIKVEHRVYVNNTQLRSMYKPDIMRLIVKVEQDIQDLKNIKSKSTAISKEIKRQKKALKFIVTYLDQV